MIDLLIESILIIGYSLTIACITLFLDFCIGSPGSGEPSPFRIFSKYGLYIYQKYLDMEDREERRIQKLLKQIRESNIDPRLLEKRERNAQRSRKVNFWKAAGVCIICFNIWIGLASLPVYLFYFQFSPVFIIPMLVISNTALRVFKRLV
jgi:hypothetical protein